MVEHSAKILASEEKAIIIIVVVVVAVVIIIIIIIIAVDWMISKSVPLSLSFTVKPKAPRVTPKSATKKEGDVGKAWCVFEYHLNDSVVIKWYKDGTLIPNTSTEFYTTPKLTVSEYDGSVISCSVTVNGVSSDRSTSSLKLTGL